MQSVYLKLKSTEENFGWYISTEDITSPLTIIKTEVASQNCINRIFLPTFLVKRSGLIFNLYFRAPCTSLIQETSK
ncbi:hypothetical protein WA1_17595 [Scytonema hofmannii PCC 7110]|uniref:Uncharacterized protein n=1 Tax=Scytonema hofmannii PCC 7110 TaxID=128403 RepID=A0A139XAV7_9CYAN|nr:hypothetical protein WA1_17595 [Scytonema hofmannii PCC 7110]